MKKIDSAFDFEDVPIVPDLSIPKNEPAKIDKAYILESYKSSNPIILYAAEELLKGVSSDSSTDYSAYILTQKQISYIENLLLEMSNIEKILGILPAEIVIWKRQNKLFNYIINIIKESQADKLESAMWEAAANPENKDNIAKMFLLKARKQEYKDNAPPPPTPAISLRISIEGQPIDTLVTSHKAVYDVSDTLE